MFGSRSSEITSNGYTLIKVFITNTYQKLIFIYDTRQNDLDTKGNVNNIKKINIDNIKNIVSNKNRLYPGK